MNSAIKLFLSKFSRTKVYALVGRSGTGKSFRAQSIAYKYRIPLIIDDGLLIEGDKIVCGKSAKQEESFLAAVKCAVFKNPEHKEEALQALNRSFYRKILIIGTSENMVVNIAKELNLPAPKVIIRIEDIASPEEINTAMKIRYTEGKHVIPVSPIQITRSYPKIVYDAVKGLTAMKFGKLTQTEKTLVKPQFSKNDQNIITIPALKQMISQSLFDYGNSLKVETVEFETKNNSYNVLVVLRTPARFNEAQKNNLTKYISDSLEKYGGILINSLKVEIQAWS